MKAKMFLLLAAFLASIAGKTFETTNSYVQDTQTTMNSPATLGYVILYVKDVPASMAFYEKAFGLSRRFFRDEHGKAYGELETGAARLAFASLELADEHLKQPVAAASLDKAPAGIEIAFVTADVRALYTRAVEAGAVSVSEPAAKPWGQTVACLRDNNGHIVEICTPLP